VSPAALDDDGGAPGWRRSWRKRAEVAAIAGVGTPLLRMLGATVRWTTTGADTLAAIDRSPEPQIWALWHGRILPCMWYFRNRGIVVVTSENFDGEWIGRIIQRFGFGAARGSSSRGGARALRSLLRSIGRQPAAFTVDGPRGPRGVVQPGIVWLAKATGAPIIPVHAEADRYWTLGSWDRTQIPRPFARVAMAIGPPIRVAREADDAGMEAARMAVEAGLHTAEAASRAALGGATTGR